MKLPPSVRGARAAFVFLTRLPFGGFPYSDEDYAWAPAHGPLVGLVVGGIGAVVFALAFGAGAPAASILGLAATILATGAFHEDGLADTSDALGGAIFDRERLLVILKDSRIGTYGAVAVAITIGLRAALITDIGTAASSGAAAFIISHMLGRVAPTVLMTRMPYVTDKEHAKSRPIVRAGGAQALVAVTYGVAVVTASVWWLPDFGLGPLYAALAMIPATILCAWRFQRRAGGITGDFLGATEQVNEMTVLLVLALMHP
ncbi:MAG: adenosylcobinamide-GDP ribazoletransferase [Planctomycetota bacterium]